MTFVAVLVSGITLSISTCLKVWQRSQETAELNQDARAILEVLSRDVRGAYLGLDRRAGYFLGGVPEGADSLTASEALLEFTTESSAITKAALLPEEERAQDLQEIGPPVTDFVAVRYELRRDTGTSRGGLYRVTWVAPIAKWLEEQPPETAAVSVELISESVVGFALRYYDGEAWLEDWTTSEGNLRLPGAVAVELTLLDPRDNEHVYQ
ncbi:MAG: type II secretion system protein GspJ, partial [Armatimonadetes bacterium]|nr:type II secretion system protein GspJ [Armatimonadota bacterium]